MRETLVDRLINEADLCRHDGADDIAALLEEAAAALICQGYCKQPNQSVPVYIDLTKGRS